MKEEELELLEEELVGEFCLMVVSRGMSCAVVEGCSVHGRVLSGS